MKGFNLVDDVIKEPWGGAHAQPVEMANILKDYLTKTIKTLSKKSASKRIDERIAKFEKMGFFDENVTS